jgi:hypothetical protein
MADRKALALYSGSIQEVQSGDNLLLPSDPSANLHAATKQYTDVRSLTVADGVTTGEENFSRRLINTQGASLITGVFCLSYFTARKSETITQVRTSCGSPAAAATPTLCRIGLYTIDSSGNGTLVASIANDTTLWAAIGTAYTRTLSASYAKVAGQRYASAILVVTSVATPSLTGILAPATVVATEWAMSLRLSGRMTGQSDLPSSFLESSLSPSSPMHYSVWLP